MNQQVTPTIDALTVRPGNLASFWVPASTMPVHAPITYSLWWFSPTNSDQILVIPPSELTNAAQVERLVSQFSLNYQKLVADENNLAADSPMLAAKSGCALKTSQQLKSEFAKLHLTVKPTEGNPVTYMFKLDLEHPVGAGVVTTLVVMQNVFSALAVQVVLVWPGADTLTLLVHVKTAADSIVQTSGPHTLTLPSYARHMQPSAYVKINQTWGSPLDSLIVSPLKPLGLRPAKPLESIHTQAEF